MERIVFLDRKTCRARFNPPRFLHEWREYDLTPPDQIVDRLLDATMAITNKVPLRAKDLKPLRALRLIAVAATGVDNVDLDYCQENGITVCNVPNYTRDSVPEHVFMGILAIRRNLFNYRRAMQSGIWPKSPTFSFNDYPVHNLAGSTLGIIGYGQLAREVEKRAIAFGMKVIIAERKHALDIRPGRLPFKEVIGASDVLTLHCPLSPETRMIIGSTELTYMKPGAILVNAARGGLVDETALAQALRTGLLGGAMIDVLSQEPPYDDNPLLNLDLPNLVITPHIGWASEEAVQALADQVILNMEYFAAGSPKNVVTK